MKFGVHSQEVEDVVRFAMSQQLFSGRGPFDDSTLLIHDLEHAKNLAWSDYIAGTNSTWTDLREEELSVVGVALDRHPDRGEIKHNIDVFLDQLSVHIRQQVRRNQYRKEEEPLLDDAIGDLLACAESRAAWGKESKFYEQLFRIYLGGGWPCGWSGAYPEGRMMAYVRK